MSTPPLLELHNVSKVYARGLLAREQVVALREISLTIDDARPSIIAVAGESGSGKTTLGSLVLGFIQPTTGSVRYRGQDVARLSGADYLRFRREVQAVFQDPFAVFNPFYRVDHLLETPIAKFKLARSKQEAQRMMEEALNAVGLRPDEVLGRFPHQLSGGQRQRITIARALLLKPRLLVADEPVSMVDASLRATILESLRRMRDEHGISILYITHDLTTAYHVSDTILVLYAGGVVEAGDAEQVIRSPKHPYTQVLIDSIPWPDVERRWGTVELVQREEKGEPGGCRFFARCPAAMPRCAQSVPGLYRVSPTQAAACFLHEGQAAALDEVLRERAVVHG